MGGGTSGAVMMVGTAPGDTMGKYDAEGSGSAVDYSVPRNCVLRRLLVPSLLLLKKDHLLILS